MSISVTITWHALTYLRLLINNNYCYIFSSFFVLSIGQCPRAHKITYLHKIRIVLFYLVYNSHSQRPFSIIYILHHVICLPVQPLWFGIGLCQTVGQAPSFEDIFNAPASVVSHGRPPSPHSCWSLSLTLTQPVPRHHGSVRTGRSPVRQRHCSASASSTTSHVHCPEKCGHSTDRSPLTGPPKKLLKCEWHNGEASTGRPGARDYELEVSSLILKSICKFEACVVTHDPVPLPDKQTTWVTECWTNACADLEEKYKLPDRIIGLVSHQESGSITKQLMTQSPADQGVHQQCSFTPEGCCLSTC